MSTYATRVVLFLITLLFLLQSGCGQSAPYETVPVTGQVQYEDGTLIPNRVVLRFYPEAEGSEPKLRPRIGTAEVAADGTFQGVTTHHHHDGATLGMNRIVVMSLDASEVPTNAVPAEFGNQTRTPLREEIVANGAPLKIRIPKPQGSLN